MMPAARFARCCVGDGRALSLSVLAAVMGLRLLQSFAYPKTRIRLG